MFFYQVWQVFSANFLFQSLFFIAHSSHYFYNSEKKWTQKDKFIFYCCLRYVLFVAVAQIKTGVPIIFFLQKAIKIKNLKENTHQNWTVLMQRFKDLKNTVSRLITIATKIAQGHEEDCKIGGKIRRKTTAWTLQKTRKKKGNCTGGNMDKAMQRTSKERN